MYSKLHSIWFAFVLKSRVDPFEKWKFILQSDTSESELKEKFCRRPKMRVDMLKCKQEFLAAKCIPVFLEMVFFVYRERKLS